MSRLYGPLYDTETLKERAVHCLSVNGKAKEARLLQALLAGMTDRHRVIAAIQKAGVWVFE